METQIALSIAQMNELKCLGLNIHDASLAWVPVWDESGKHITNYFLEEYSFGSSHCRYVPAYTLGDVLNKLPQYIHLPYDDKRELHMFKNGIGYLLPEIDRIGNVVGYKNKTQLFVAASSLLEAAFVLLKKIIANDIKGVDYL